MSLSNIELGKLGEELAVDFLRKKRCKIIKQNYSCLFGEIDIIAKFKRSLFFIEVKTRHSSKFGFPQEAVDKKKQKQISKVALHYLTSHQLTKIPARFDVISILLDTEKQIKWIQNAFPLTERYSY